MSSTTHSRHIFIFPFQWDCIESSSGRKEDSSYGRRTDLDTFDRLFSQVSPLRRRYFEIGECTEHYNEYVYFHPFARKALYGTRENKSIYFYELEVEGGSYHIEINTGSISVTYELKLESISLHAYETGVGIVSFSLYNDKYIEEEDILRINDFGRRLYPQYMDSENRLTAKSTFLANSISGNLGDMNFYDDFSQYLEEVDHRRVFLPPDHIRQVFGYKPTDRLGDDRCKFVFSDQDERKGKIRISPVMDDRMYFLCYIESNDLAQQLKGSSKAVYDYETGKKVDFWYRYLFGDGLFKGIENGRMQVEEIKRCSYARWIDMGTLIGITRDSAVYVSNLFFIGVHFRTMYYQMAILCLIQRASILRFSGEISYLTSQIRRGKKRAGSHIKELYENYIRFLNEIYFREVTSQIQGMEMYEMFHKNMNIERDTKALETEMTELFGYLDIDEQSKLNRIANVYLPLGLLTGVLGINTFMQGGLFTGLFGREDSCSRWMAGDIVTILVMLLCLFVPIRYYLTIKK
ncbi:hypothetical protein [Porphyromonas gulae]|uniref:CorA-like Mg2+ transporter protein n=1 Tax=Porphyromonas gulae TaxID=111105 RepID=A0A0A2FUB6_9PORP|nr:hypothetical protein [Porphyromonas gulae]KGN94593.1 hypothetical protein HR15_00775 [Porphyromonas gulae]KKC50750.1 hypothetical protein HR10_07895 [Porphyromonas gulae]